MKRSIYIIWVILFALAACRDSEVKPLFDKSADERTAEAIANLKDDLTAPANGYKLKYRPSDDAGSFYVFLKFNEDNTVRIRTDLAAEDTRFFDDTITYRVDSSLGLELIMESYSFFGFLYDLDEATFGAEYEFNYSSKTPDDALVFVSKTDPIEPRTRLLFEPATAADLTLHTTTTNLSKNLNIMATDLKVYTQPYKITYDTRDLILYVSLDDLRRTLVIGSASKKSNLASTATVDFSTSYILEGDSIVFDEPLKGLYLGVNVSLRSIKLNTLQTSSITACTDPITTHAYKGVASSGESVTMEPTLNDPVGGLFANTGSLFRGPLGYAFRDGEEAYPQLVADLKGVAQFQLYYNYDIGTPLTGLGFLLENSGADPTFALREFTMTRTGNKLTLNFTTPVTLFNNANPDADVNKVVEYLDLLTQGNVLYVFRTYNEGDGVYEFHNPCTGWSYVTVSTN